MFQISDVLRKGWEGFKANAEVLLITLLISWGITALVIAPLEIARVAAGDNLALALSILGVRIVLQTIVGVFFQLGFITISLKVVRGEKPKIGDLFVNRRKLLPAILLSLLLGLAISIGTMLLIVPGIILALMTCLAIWFMVDRDMGVMDSIKASIAATRGAKGTLFLFWMVCVGLSLLALIPCGLGYIVLVPVLNVATGHIYVTLTKARESEQDPAGQRPLI